MYQKSAVVKKFAIKAIFDYFINQLFIEFIHYPNNPDIKEENKREIEKKQL